MSLDPAGFADFFQAVHGVKPFDWQVRLAADVLTTGGWPDVLNLPTGVGKTATLDVAVYHLAAEAARGAQRRAPLRIAFVVDRRIVVDDAYARALKLAKALADAHAAPAVREVAQALGGLAERAEQPLLVHRLRGGTPREPDWARTPTQPTVLCSTVDQVGSRLLFRGYGVSERMRSVHAGLLGSDCLFLLDEAHLSQPFRETLDAVAVLRRGAGPAAPPPPFGFTLLTATPGERPASVFELNDAERDDGRLRPRLETPKPVRLVEVAGERGVSDEQGRLKALVEAVDEGVKAFEGATLPGPALAVIVNRVARARALHEALSARYGDRADVALVIGPARSVDRDVIMKALEPVRTGEALRDQLARPRIVVATQTLEVGADLDFDGLVTEAAALDALRQRFGRLNRVGRLNAADTPGVEPYAAILGHKADVSGKTEDPVYGLALARTWAWLKAWAQEGTPDVSSKTMDARLARAVGDGLELETLLADVKAAPVLMPAYVDLWSQTWPAPASSPEVSLFLHGRPTPPGVQIVWRDDIDVDRPDAAGGLLALVPPRAAEAVEVPVAAARRWLAGLTDGSDFADAPEAVEPDARPGARPAAGRKVLRWSGGPEGGAKTIGAGQLRPGDLVVAPSSYGGCDRYGWAPAAEQPVTDVADLAARPYAKRRFALRLTPGRLQAERERLRQAGETAEQAQARDETYAALSRRLAEHLDTLEGPQSGAPAAEGLQALLDPEDGDAATREGLEQDPLWCALQALNATSRVEAHYPYGLDDEERPRGLVLLAPRGLSAEGRSRLEACEPAIEEDVVAGGEPSTEDDGLGLDVELERGLAAHSNRIRDIARRFADRLGLPEGLANDVTLAAYLHDAGKADARFQRFLAGGDWRPEALLAKSKAKHLPRDLWTRVGLPDHWRHEALSVRLALINPALEAARDPGLVLWLVGVHHGFGRPFFPHADPLDEETRRFEPLDGLVPETLAPGCGPQSLGFGLDHPVFAPAGQQGLDWTGLFARLRERYGAWDLARLEAVVRLADHRASEAGEGAP